jgi:hypothetical protein
VWAVSARIPRLNFLEPVTARLTRPENIMIWSLLRLVAIVHVVVPKPLRTFGPDALKPVIKRDLPNRRGNLRLCGWAASC